MAAKIHAAAELFEIFASFVTSQETMAPVVYNTLVFALIEASHHTHDHVTRAVYEFMLKHMASTLRDFATVPVGVVAESIAHSTTVGGCCEAELELISVLCRHHTLAERHARALLEPLVSCVCVSDVVLAPDATASAIHLARRFIDGGGFRQFFAKVLWRMLQLLPSIFAKTRALQNLPQRRQNLRRKATEEPSHNHMVDTGAVVTAVNEGYAQINRRRGARLPRQHGRGDKDSGPPESINYANVVAKNDGTGTGKELICEEQANLVLCFIESVVNDVHDVQLNSELIRMVSKVLPKLAKVEMQGRMKSDVTFARRNPGISKSRFNKGTASVSSENDWRLLALRRLAQIIETVHDLRVDNGESIASLAAARTDLNGSQTAARSNSTNVLGRKGGIVMRSSKSSPKLSRRLRELSVATQGGPRLSPMRQRKPLPPEPLDALGPYLRGLRALFKHAVEHVFGSGVKRSRHKGNGLVSAPNVSHHLVFGSSSTQSFEERLREQTEMRLSAWCRMLRELKIVPTLLSQVVATNIFHRATFIDENDGGIDDASGKLRQPQKERRHGIVAGREQRTRVLTWPSFLSAFSGVVATASPPQLIRGKEARLFCPTVPTSDSRISPLPLVALGSQLWPASRSEALLEYLRDEALKREIVPPSAWATITLPARSGQALLPLLNARLLRLAVLTAVNDIDNEGDQEASDSLLTDTERGRGLGHDVLGIGQDSAYELGWACALFSRDENQLENSKVDHGHDDEISHDEDAFTTCFPRLPYLIPAERQARCVPLALRFSPSWFRDEDIHSGESGLPPSLMRSPNNVIIVSEAVSVSIEIIDEIMHDTCGADLLLPVKCRVARRCVAPAQRRGSWFDPDTLRSAPKRRIQRQKQRKRNSKEGTMTSQRRGSYFGAASKAEAVKIDQLAKCAVQKEKTNASKRDGFGSRVPRKVGLPLVKPLRSSQQQLGGADGALAERISKPAAPTASELEERRLRIAVYKSAKAAEKKRRSEESEAQQERRKAMAQARFESRRKVVNDNLARLASQRSEHERRKAEADKSTTEIESAAAAARAKLDARYRDKQRASLEAYRKRRDDARAKAEARSQKAEAKARAERAREARRRKTSIDERKAKLAQRKEQHRRQASIMARKRGAKATKTQRKQHDDSDVNAMVTKRHGRGSDVVHQAENSANKKKIARLSPVEASKLARNRVKTSIQREQNARDAKLAKDAAVRRSNEKCAVEAQKLARRRVREKTHGRDLAVPLVEECGAAAPDTQPNAARLPPAAEAKTTSMTTKAREDQNMHTRSATGEPLGPAP